MKVLVNVLLNFAEAELQSKRCRSWWK